MDIYVHLDVYFLMSKTILVTDYSWFSYRNEFAFRNLSLNRNGVEIKTGVIFGTFQSLLSIINKNPEIEIYMCLDGTPTKQLSVDANYKGQRDHDANSAIGIPYMKLAGLCSLLPQVKLVYHKDMEADECMSFLCEMLPRTEGDRILLFTTDGDLHQEINDEKRIFVTNKLSEGIFEEINEHDCFVMGPKDLRGLRPEAIPLFKAICGDKADNVIGIERFPTKLAKQIANQFVTIEKFEDWLLNHSQELQNESMNRLRANLDQVKKNWRIVKIDPDNIPDIIEVMEGATMDTFDFYELKSIKTQVERIINERGDSPQT